jgi:pimeloyl-ACP methyl ester carboxylesterase
VPATGLARGNPNSFDLSCLVDAAQRTVLFFDALRQRGNNYLEHTAAGEPPLLKFEHERVLDGRALPRPCNYLLLHLLPPVGVAPAAPNARPLVIVDPRAGHGPGIGGFKSDSEVGVAMRAGHPVYFIAFRPQPEDGQLLGDVMMAEARFLEEVAARHPLCAAKPIVIGNCQAGWAMAMLAAVRPELCGPLMLVGAPLSYWAGSSKQNPMRYAGATLGGSWLASLTADLAGDRFDGAHLVDNFERLNPANTLWGRYYRLWSEVDTEAERFLDFEQWWGGYFRMTGAEIETIVENLFVGNKLARGEVKLGEHAVDLRNIRSPIVVFASHGDNITPPPQALDWIIDTWGSERAIAAAGRVIVYMLHERVGHLGIFVGADIARKEHDQIVTSLDVVEHLPPGLYEMHVVSKDGERLQRWDELEPGSYSVEFQHRTMDDLRALNPEGREEEQLFSTLAQLSEQNARAYKTWVRPWLQMLPLKAWGDAMTEFHPLRWQRRLWSDSNPAARLIGQAAETVRAGRHAVAVDHPGRQWEAQLTSRIESALNQWRDQRDQSVVQWTRLAFGPWGLGALYKPAASTESTAVARALAEIESHRQDVLAHVADGGPAQAVCRIVLAGMTSLGNFERRSFRLARLLAALQPTQGPNWLDLMHAEARIAAVAPVEALNSLGQMLPTQEQREHALAVAAAVMMIEPTLDNPRSEIIELLIGMLDLDATRVMDLACSMTASLSAPGDAAEALPAPASSPVARRAPARLPARARRAAGSTRLAGL